MKLRDTRALAILGSLGIGLMLAQPAAAETVLKAGHINQPDSPLGLGFQKFAELVEEKSDGEMTIQVFPASQLGPIDAQFENLTAGSQDIMIELLEWYQRWDKRFGIFGLPYIWRDREHMSAFLASDYFQDDMLPAIEERIGATFLADEVTWNFMLDRTLLCKEPVFTPADLEGMKLRMFQARIPVLSWETLGASVQIIPWGEVYTALATGTVDCVTARVEAHYNTKQTEVAKYITETDEFYQVYLPVISNRTLERLSDAQVAILKEAAAEAGHWFTDYTLSQKEAFEERVREEHGVSIINPPLAPWRETMAPAYETFEAEGEIPAGMVERVRSIE
ncbi:TRAP transporter substrate-binding protein [Roseospira navarrensis]|uniref:C4-dicarboxylate ABC transporter substrate-binding protein n=1 Tax=Roseospira navarrensis TaxID=140058 RepID=A0A7X2D4D2_9PROT|nr:TRAP transporter substrate-binding protein [Roseospira navarrensis]MQX37808.1 hypothetical protein [Roseospira navarrensis]